MTFFCFLLFLTSRYFNKGVHYCLIALSVWFWLSKPQKNLFSNITYSWMKHAVSDKNVKRTGRQQHINVK